MSQPPNLPEILQARMKLALFNWGKRTIIWTGVLGLLTAFAPGLRFVLIGWLIFSGISLAALLLGLKLAKNLKTGTAAVFPPATNEPRDVGGHRPEFSYQEKAPQPHAHSGRSAVSDEIIEIEAEVLPPDQNPR